MNIHTNLMAGKMEVNLEGNLSIERSEELRQFFLGRFKDSDPLVLNLDGVESVHVSCLQILCSAHRSFWALDRSLTLKGKIPKGFKRGLEEAGFDRERGCPLDRSQTCLFALGG